MANNNANAKKSALTIFALMILVLVLILGLVIGVIITISNTSIKGSSTPSYQAPSGDTSSVDTTSDIVSSDVSSETSSNVSSEVSSNNVSVISPSSKPVSSTVSQNPTVPDGKKVVYLTFDDGPSKNTPKLLDTLDQLGVKATFFVTGTAANIYPQNLKEIVNRGHAVALHTYSHEYYEVYKSEDAYFNDLQKVSDLVYNLTGVRSKIIRFPGGSSNGVSKQYCPGIMTSLTKKVIDRGYQYYDWNVDSGDADDRTMSVEYLTSYFKTQGLKPYINLLMHDTADKYTTIDALPTIVKYYRDLGYEFDVIDENAYVCHHGKLNN